MAKKLKKIISKTLLVLLIIIPLAAIVHYIVFPQQTRCILIDYSNFVKDGRIYFNATTPQSKIDTLKILIEQASTRIDGFWGVKTSDPKFIYCDNKEDFKKYSNAPNAPAVTHLKLGAYIVLSKDGADKDIIAHEISHAELYKRVGFYKWNFVIPPWFKHGLAMQNDNRDYYSEDTLKARSGNFKNLPDIKKFTKDEDFYSGNLEQVMLNYMTAKYDFKTWYTKEKLEKLIQELNAGRSFKEAFGQ